MTNLCRNFLLVRGSPLDLLIFKDTVCGEEGDLPLDFDRILPMPVELAGEQTTEQHKANVEKCGYGDWDDWRCAHWGTNRNLDEIEVSEGPDSLWYTFSTPWSPPLSIFEALTEIFPRLTFSGNYIEHDMGFCGAFTGENGIFSDTELDYETAAIFCAGPRVC